MGVKYRVRRWYAVELDDGRDEVEIRAWLRYGMNLIEARHGVQTSKHKVWRERSRTGSQNYYWLMEGISREVEG